MSIYISPRLKASSSLSIRPSFFSTLMATDTKTPVGVPAVDYRTATYDEERTRMEKRASALNRALTVGRVGIRIVQLASA